VESEAPRTFGENHFGLEPSCTGNVSSRIVFFIEEESNLKQLTILEH
jgi:hypothetical protein